MTFAKRLRLLTGILGATAATVAVGTSVFGDIRGGTTGGPAVPAAARPAVEVEDLARTKFSGQPTLTYKTSAGQTVFAWQVKPALPVVAPQPRDVLVMIDTSASQAGVPLARARNVLAALTKSAGPDDRFDVWTANINNAASTRSLTQGFRSANAAEVTAAVAKLSDAEYGAGAVDLKSALEKAVGQFEGRAGRQQVLLYLGDGESAGSTTPLNELARIEIGNRLADREVSFFAVPLGAKLHPHNLHGLASLTGGALVRLTEDLDTVRGKDDAGVKLRTAFDVPVLRVEKTTFGPAGMEVFPTRLPPLRADRATLVIGTLAADAPAVTAKVEGRVNGAKLTVDLAERLPAARTEHYFLNAMVQQWRSAASKDAPAMLAADRALAMASTQFGLFRDEFVTQGVWAVSSDRLDHAEKLFAAAAKIDPESTQARLGAQMVAKIRAGDMTKDRLKKRLDAGMPINKLLDGQDPADPPAPPAGAKTPAGPLSDPAIERARAAQQVQEQETRILVEETLRRTRRLRDVDPDAAYLDLKRQRDAILGNDLLSPTVRRNLVNSLEGQMQDTQRQGAEIKRKIDAERERIARARQSVSENDRIETIERQTQARVDQFKQLMQRARFEEAYQEAQVMIAERIDRGLVPIPVETVAAYRIGQSAYHLREAKELKRIRENNYLMTMMQVEKSFIPYPDEPPVHFPPARVWQQLIEKRDQNNRSLRFGKEVPASMQQLEYTLEEKVVNLQTPLKGMKLSTLVDTLRDTYKVQFFVREDLFPPDPPIIDQAFKISSQLNGVRLGSFLDVVLLDIGASYIVRPEYIEIVPRDFRLTEKQFRAFEVADLVIPIPNSVNNQALQQNLALFGAQLQFAGQSQGAANFLGGFGGGFGGIQGGQIGQIGQMGGGGGMQANQFGQMGQVNNLGVGGGINGVTGGQLGQFGNLGGQFGIQGGNQANVLIDLIRLTVAYREWDRDYVGVQPVNQPGQNGDEESGPLVPPEQLNSLGYYPSALALVVRGSTRYHPNSSFKLRAPAGGGLGAAPQGNPAKAGDKLAGNMVAPKDTAKGLIAKAGKDPKKLWNEVFDRAVTNPTLVVEAADLLFAYREYGQAAEALKASLRKGRATGAWAFEALTIALQQSQAAPAEVERAALSGVDLDPADAKAYLRAAKAESEIGQTAQALAFCQRAATIEPNLPTSYANALVYAERATDVQADVVHWAAENLLRRDWQADGTDYHDQTRKRGTALVKKFDAAGKKADADKLEKVLNETKQRDLVIELLWQGPADLDLSVSEPSGSVCSASHKRTTGGGVLRSDILEQKDDNRAEQYAASSAFAGSYVLNVKSALGRPYGNKATIKVTKFQGTAKEEFEVHSVDLNDPKPIRVVLEGGSRRDLATIPQDSTGPTRNDTTAAQTTVAPTGMSAGAGAGSTNLLSSPTSMKMSSAMAVVNQSVEEAVPGMAGVMPGMRVEAKVSADRSKVVIQANPVFAGPAVDIAMPKVNLLPGSETN